MTAGKKFFSSRRAVPLVLLVVGKVVGVNIIPSPLRVTTSSIKFLFTLKPRRVISVCENCDWREIELVGTTYLSMPSLLLPPKCTHSLSESHEPPYQKTSQLNLSSSDRIRDSGSSPVQKSSSHILNSSSWNTAIVESFHPLNVPCPLSGVVRLCYNPLCWLLYYLFNPCIL